MAYGMVNAGGASGGAAALGQRYCEVESGTTSTSNMVYAAAVGDDFTLTAGERITVRFKRGNADYDIKINVNGTGAKNVYHNGERVMNIKADSVYDMLYDGEGWNVVGMKDTNTTYNNATESSSGLMSAADKKIVNSVANLMTESGFVSGAKLFSGYRDKTVTIAAGSYYGENHASVDELEEYADYESRAFIPVLLTSSSETKTVVPVNVSLIRDAKAMGIYPRLYVSRMPGAETAETVTATVRVYWIEP